MKKSKQNLTKIRLMCAVLASIELANAGVSSYAMKPSDPTSSQIQTNFEIKEHIINSVEMAKMASNELLQYLMITSTPDKLKNYYQNRETCKSKQDIINFEALSPETKDNLFEYIFRLISERQLENFQSIPIEIRTNFFEYIIKKDYDLLDVLAGIGINEYDLGPNEFEDFMEEMLTVVSSRMAGIIFGKLILEAEDPFINAMINAVDYDSLVEVTANILNFDCDKNIAKECNLIDYAALIGNVYAFKYLMMNDAIINENTIIWALMGGNAEIIQLISQTQEIDFDEIADDGDILNGITSANREDLWNWIKTNSDVANAEEIALSCCKTGNLSFLIKVFDDVPSESLNKLLVFAAGHGNVEIVKFLIDNGAEIDYPWKETALQAAIDFAIDQESRRGYLIENYPEANTEKCQKLKRQDIEKIQLLIDNGADVNAVNDKGDTALIYAVEDIYNFSNYNGRFDEIVQLLIDNGADINATNNNGENALTYAVNFAEEPGLFNIITILINNGADINILPQNEKDYLLSQFINDDNNIADILIKNGANIEKIDKNETCKFLLWAMQEDKTELVKFLIDNGANISARNKRGQTLLMYSLLNNKIEMARLLIENRADINARDNHGHTALMYAAFNNNLEIAQLLIDNGASANATDNDGNTASDIALKKDNYELAQFLKENEIDL